MQLGEKQIIEILTKCYPGLREPVLSAEEAQLRGRMIFEDIGLVRFPLMWECDWPVEPPGFEPVRVPSYRLPGVSYGALADPDGTKGRDAAGPAISCGEFVRLSRACLLGRKVLGSNRWPSLFATRLRDSDDWRAPAL